MGNGHADGKIAPIREAIVLQHVPFEGPAYLSHLLSAMNTEPRILPVHAGGLPDAVSPEKLLVVMGGPMSVHDTRNHPWLAAEIRYIERHIRSGGSVLGICLGAQLIAACLGASVYKNSKKEIGWYPIQRTGSDLAEPLDQLPTTLKVFHWHGDTFEVPEGAIRIYSSQACKNQGFLYGDRVLALQFHLESTYDSIKLLLENCSDDLADGDFVATPEAMIDIPESALEANHRALSLLAEYLLGMLTK